MLLKNYLKVFLITPKPHLLRYYSQEYVPKALRSLKGKSVRSTVQFYVDSQRVRAVAGNGGDGCISFLSVWCKDHAGPDGGDGGNGGHVIFQASHTVKGLNHCNSVIQAKHGEKGFNKDCSGKNAPHVVIPVPIGTIVKDGRGTVVGDLNAEGVMFVAARGGAGGRGNKFFLTDTEQAPDVAELGAEGETNVYTLEVRSMAHIGLIGFPNAGKSTLLRALTRARPNVAPYPFTTLRPHIGMIPYDDYEQVAIADLPGLIPGSHKNRGLGIQFLQHVERCRGLIFLLDGTNNPLEQYESLSYELNQYSRALTQRPNIIVVNKIDLKEGRLGLEDVKRGVMETNVADSEATVADSVEKVADSVMKVAASVTEVADSVIKVADSVTKVAESVTKVADSVTKVADSVAKLADSELRGSAINIDHRIKQNSEDRMQNKKRNSVYETPIQVFGISAKTGMNLSQLLRVVRQMYDSGDNR